MLTGRPSRRGSMYRQLRLHQSISHHHKEIVSSLKLRNPHSKDFGLHLSSGIFACCLHVNQRIISMMFMTRFCGWMKMSRKVCVSLSVLSDSLWPRGLCSPPLSMAAPLSMEFSRQEYWSGGCHSLSRGSSWPRNWTQVPCIACRFFTVWATEKTWEGGRREEKPLLYVKRLSFGSDNAGYEGTSVLCLSEYLSFF